MARRSSSVAAAVILLGGVVADPSTSFMLPVISLSKEPSQSGDLTGELNKEYTPRDLQTPRDLPTARDLPQCNCEPVSYSISTRRRPATALPSASGKARRSSRTYYMEGIGNDEWLTMALPSSRSELSLLDQIVQGEPPREEEKTDSPTNENISGPAAVILLSATAITAALAVDKK